MQITRLQNGLDLTGMQLYLLDDPDYQPTVETTKRIGIDCAPARVGGMRPFASLTQIGGLVLATIRAVPVRVRLSHLHRWCRLGPNGKI